MNLEASNSNENRAICHTSKSLDDGNGLDIVSSLPRNDHERRRRTRIMNSIDNLDYLLIIATREKKTIEQVKYELKLKLIHGD